LLGPGPRLIKKNLAGRGLTKVEKHWIRDNCLKIYYYSYCVCRVGDIIGIAQLGIIYFESQNILTSQAKFA